MFVGQFLSTFGYERCMTFDKVEHASKLCYYGLKNFLVHPKCSKNTACGACGFFSCQVTS